MKAVMQERYGPTEVLQVREVERPNPGDNDVLVKVQAASVNALDWHLMRGDPYLARLGLGIRRPKEPIRGRDFAGRVEAVGRGVTDLKPGDEVYGAAVGAFAEYACAPATSIGLKPANLSFEQAAATPIAGITALMGLRAALGAPNVHKGQSILVNGASGGVGTFAVQLSKHLGAEVSAVCSTRNVDLVSSLGADRVIDYTKEDFTHGGKRYDVVFDLVGNRSLGALRRVLTPKGTLVLSGGGVSKGGSVIGPLGLIVRAMLAKPFVAQRVVILTAVVNRANLDSLRELAEAGAYTPAIDRSYPLAETAEAIRYLEVEHARAKVVITV
jgi:NADPH:quinone reductase-like Zn-dependent oxidoreductase